MGTILPIIDKNNLNAKIENLADGIQIDLSFNEKEELMVKGLFTRWIEI
jgi:hypothetical protein